MTNMFIKYEIDTLIQEEKALSREVKNIELARGLKEEAIRYLQSKCNHVLDNPIGTAKCLICGKIVINTKEK